ncbi:UvrD-helicase domain-containing protein [Cohnella ginsengisoli]|uniref:UvrD-helicase domain-containing protein n=1 Tax=Cohnella ginsengisoli TaxID=425004 RepID=UPI002405EA5B|nr:UvrD-helicase domain-containing protein [Cohnella ginsengisoli]
MNIIESVIGYFQNRKIKKECQRVGKYINSFEWTVASLKSIANDFSKRRSLITDDEISGVLLKYNDLKQYIDGNNVANVDEQSRSFFIARSGAIASKEYLELTKRYQKLKGNYVTALTNIEKAHFAQNQVVEQHTVQATQFLKKVNLYRQDYFVHSRIQPLKESFLESFNFFQGNVADIKDGSVKTFVDYYDQLDRYVESWNTEYIQDQLLKQQQLFNNIDGKALDQQQRIAVVTDEDNNLVLAGAGSGKTLTISGKVKYLVDVKGISPSEILLISFTRKSANEMAERIKGKLDVPVDVKTFHKLGLGIIGQVTRSTPDVFDDLPKVLDNYFKDKIFDDGSQIKNLIEFFGYYISIPKDYSEFNNLGEYHDYYKNIDFETLKGKVNKTVFAEQAAGRLAGQKRTINGETVKSFEETLIANFLFLNGVSYEYERMYPFNTADEFHRQYKPDFYLPDYDLYLEHFGVDEHNRTPWLSPVEEQKYLEDMVWKRGIHSEKGTTLIETYSHYNKNGVLLEKLKEKLIAHQVKFREADYQAIFTKIYDIENQDRYFKELVKLINSFLGLFKSNGFGETHFTLFLEENKKSAASAFTKMRTKMFMEMVQPIFIHYQEELRRNKAIDFNDMINMATDYVKAEKIRFDYKYIMIDEYQDISTSRFELIKAIKDQTNAKVMCVGDDWQSIYRFAGSDIQLFTKFGEFFWISPADENRADLS